MKELSQDLEGTEEKPITNEPKTLYTVRVFCQHSEYDSFLTNQSPYLKFHTTIAIVVRLFESRRLKMHNVFLSLIAYDSTLPPEVARCFHVC